MKPGICALVLLFMSAITQAALHDHAWRTSVDANGKEIGWYVTDEQFLKSPEWKFDGKTHPPLDMPAAYQRAYVWIKRAFPKTTSFKLNSYGLSAAGSPKIPNRWYYTFDFFGSIDGSIVDNPRFSVMVLMDGTVIEPRTSK